MGEHTAAVLPRREEVSVVSAALGSRDDSGEVGPSSLSDDDSLEDSRASKAEDRRPETTGEVRRERVNTLVRVNARPDAIGRTRGET